MSAVYPNLQHIDIALSKVLSGLEHRLPKFASHTVSNKGLCGIALSQSFAEHLWLLFFLPAA
jgi:hypothetical protein